MSKKEQKVDKAHVDFESRTIVLGDDTKIAAKVHQLELEVKILKKKVGGLEEITTFLDKQRVHNAKIMNEVVIQSLPWYVRRRIQKKMNSFNEDTVVM